MEIKRCPECEKNIPATATRCRCGWVARAAQSSHIPCAFAGCPASAMLRVWTKTGWAKVCFEHDKKIVTDRAVEYCKARGLDTVEKQRAWLMGNRATWKRAPVEISDDERDIEDIPF